MREILFRGKRVDNGEGDFATYDITQNHYGDRIILTSNEIKERAAAYGVEVEE